MFTPYHESMYLHPCANPITVDSTCFFSLDGENFSVNTRFFSAVAIGNVSCFCPSRLFRFFLFGSSFTNKIKVGRILRATRTNGQKTDRPFLLRRVLLILHARNDVPRETFLVYLPDVSTGFDGGTAPVVEWIQDDERQKRRYVFR